MEFRRLPSLQNGRDEVLFGDFGLDPADAAAALVEKENDQAADDEGQETDDTQDDDQQSRHDALSSFFACFHLYTIIPRGTIGTLGTWQL